MLLFVFDDACGGPAVRHWWLMLPD